MINRFSLEDLSLPTWSNNDDNYHYGKKLYALARRIQFLYNDVRKSIDNGSVSRYEIYGLYYISQNILMDMAKLPTTGQYWKKPNWSMTFPEEGPYPCDLTFKNSTDKDTKYDVPAQHWKYFKKLEDPMIINEIESKFGKEYDKVIIAFDILWTSFRIFEDYIHSYMNFIDSYEDSPVFNLPHNTYNVNHPFPNFDANYNVYYHTRSNELLKEMKDLNASYKAYKDTFRKYEESRGNLVN